MGDLKRVARAFGVDSVAGIRRSPIARALLSSILCLWVAACTTTAYVVHPDKEIKYNAIWQDGWRQVAADQARLNPTASSPGLCNVGGSQRGCFAADLALIRDYRHLATALTGSVVPAEFAMATRTLQQGLAEEIRGLTDRNQVIASQDPNATFARSNEELTIGLSLLKKAVSEYRGPILPPSPFR